MHWHDEDKTLWGMGGHNEAQLTLWGMGGHSDAQLTLRGMGGHNEAQLTLRGMGGHNEAQLTSWGMGGHVEDWTPGRVRRRGLSSGEEGNTTEKSDWDIFHNSQGLSLFRSFCSIFSRNCAINSDFAQGIPKILSSGSTIRLW